MSVTYGFYNSINHDRKYDAVQFASIFDGIISDGVYENIKSSPNDPNSSPFKVKGNGYKNQVTVDIGRAWFYHTWTYNDAKIVVTLPDASIGKWRCDAIVIDIDSRQTVRENKIICVQGTKTTTTEPSSGLDAFVNAYKPDLINDGLHYQIPLYYIERRRIEDENQSPNIEDAYLKRCVGDGSLNCPYVGNMLGSIDLQAHLDHWESAWYEWFENQDTGFKKTQTDTFNAFVQSQRDAYAQWLAGFENYSNRQHAVFESWMEQEQEDFEDWCDHLRVILDENTAGHLQLEIEDLASRITPIENGGTGNNHGHIQSGVTEGNTYVYGDLGEYSTSEGMFTYSGGDASHAEGGGQYVTGYHEAGFICDQFVPSSSLVNDGGNWSATDKGEAINHSNSPIRIFSVNNGSIKSAYVGYMLKDETSGEVLQHGVGCIGAGCRDSKNYIGNLPENAEKIYFRPHYGESGGADRTYEVNDIGFFKQDYNLNDEYANDYAYIDGATPNLPNALFYIDLPPTSYDEPYAYLSGKLIPLDNTKTLESIFSLSGGVPNNVKLMWMSDYKYGNVIMRQTQVLTDDDYNDWAWWALGGDADIGKNTYNDKIATIFAGFCEIDHIRDKYFKKDGSYKLYYKNINPENRSIRIYFSGEADRSQYLNEVNQLKDTAKVYLGGYIGLSIGLPVIGTSNVKDLYLHRIGTDHIKGMNSGHTYSLSYWYSVSTSSEISYPISWIPAGYSTRGIGYPTRAIGDYSHAEGYRTKAFGRASHAEGFVYGISSEEEAPGAYGEASHSEGYGTYAMNSGSHSEGYGTKAIGAYSHAEGSGSISYGDNSHAEGTECVTGVADAHDTSGWHAHAEGSHSIATGMASHAEGYHTKALSDGAHTEGSYSEAHAMNSHAGAGAKVWFESGFAHGIFGFGGKLIPVNSNKTYGLNPDYHTNGGAWEIAANCSLAFIFNSSYYTTEDTALYRCYILTVTDGTHIEICVIITKNNTDNAPIKYVIKQSETASSFPFVTVSSNGTVTIPTASVKRQVQLIRIM